MLLIHLQPRIASIVADSIYEAHKSKLGNCIRESNIKLQILAQKGKG